MPDLTSELGLLPSIRLQHSAHRFAGWSIRYRWFLLAIGLFSLPLLGWVGADLKMNRSLSAMFSPDDPDLLQYQSLQSTFGGNHVVIIVYRDPAWKSVEGIARNRRWTSEVEKLDGVQGVLSVARLADAFRYLRPGAGFRGGDSGDGLGRSAAGAVGWLGLGSGLKNETPASSTSPGSSKTRGASESPESDTSASADSDSVPLFRSQDSLARQFLSLFDGYTHDGDSQTAAVVALLEPDSIETAVAQLKQFSAGLPEDYSAAVVGEPVLLEDAFHLIETDGRRLAIGTLGLLSMVVLFALRDIRIVGLAALCILWSTSATRSAMVWAGVELNLVSTILMAIVTVIVVAAVMHAGVRLRHPRKSEGGESGAVSVVAALTIPIAWTCLTDSAGFASLLVSDVRPVVQFGAMTAVAAAAVLVSILWFAPALLAAPAVWPIRSVADQPPEEKKNGARNRKLETVLHAAATASVARRVPLAIACIVAFFASALAVSRLSTKASFLDNFRDDSPIVQAYDRVERQLGGAGVWDVVVPMPDLIREQDLDAVFELEDQLRDLRVTVSDRYGGGTRGLTKVLSLADADAVARQASLLRFVGAEARLSGMRTALPTFADALLTYSEDEPRRLRIMLRSDEDMPAESKRQLIRLVRATVQRWAVRRDRKPTAKSISPIQKVSPDQSAADQRTSDSAVVGKPRSASESAGDVRPAPRDSRYSVTGYYVLMSQLVDRLIRDQWRAMGAALVSVGVLLWFASGSIRLTAVALLVNALPVLIVLAAVGGTGGQLDMGSAMIGAVSIGLSIDGSVHFLTAFLRRIQQGVSSETASIEAATDLGTPILLATIALVVGFAVLMTSPFVPTATFGTLVAVTLAASSLLNLTVLPALVSWVQPKPSR